MLPDPFVQHLVEGAVDGDKRAVFQPRLGREQAVPGVAVIPVEACRQFGMQIGDGKRLQAAVGNGARNCYGLRSSLFSRILSSSWQKETALTRIMLALSSIIDRAVKESRSLPIVHQYTAWLSSSTFMWAGRRFRACAGRCRHRHSTRRHRLRPVRRRHRRTGHPAGRAGAAGRTGACRRPPGRCGHSPGFGDVSQIFSVNELLTISGEIAAPM